MKVLDVMQKEVAVVDEMSSVAEAAKALLTLCEDIVIVCTKGKPIGVVTGHDIQSYLGMAKNQRIPVSRIMSSPIVSISPYADAEEALHHMDAQKLRKYPVILGGKLMGVVSLQSIVEKKNAHIRFHRSIQNLVLVLFVTFEIGIFVLSARGSP